MMLLEETFPCSCVVVDATDQGAGTAAWPARELGADRVEQFPFTGPSKSRAGFTRLTMGGTSRCTVYAPSEEEEAIMHRARFLREVAVVRYEPRFNEQLSYRVPSREGHDDYLMSMALLCQAAGQARRCLSPPSSRPTRPKACGTSAPTRATCTERSCGMAGSDPALLPSYTRLDICAGLRASECV
jgi:hypothetical protein